MHIYKILVIHWSNLGMKENLAWKKSGQTLGNIVEIYMPTLSNLDHFICFMRIFFQTARLGLAINSNCCKPPYKIPMIQNPQTVKSSMENGITFPVDTWRNNSIPSRCYLIQHACTLNSSPRDQMAAISRTTFPWMKSFVFRWKWES